MTLAPVLAGVLASQDGELPAAVTAHISPAAIRHASLDAVSWTQRTGTAVG